MFVQSISVTLKCVKIWDFSQLQVQSMYFHWNEWVGIFTMFKNYTYIPIGRSQKKWTYKKLSN